MDVENRRRSTRYALRLPVSFENGGGMTRDISSSGVFVETEIELHPMTDVIFLIELRPSSSSAPLRLRCEGDVVRCDDITEKRGMAIRFRDLEFQDADAVAAERERLDVGKERFNTNH